MSLTVHGLKIYGENTIMQYSTGMCYFCHSLCPALITAGIYADKNTLVDQHSRSPPFWHPMCGIRYIPSTFYTFMPLGPGLTLMTVCRIFKCNRFVSWHNTQVSTENRLESWIVWGHPFLIFAFMKTVTTAGETTHSCVTRTGLLHKWKSVRLLMQLGKRSQKHVFSILLMLMTKGISSM